MKSQDLREVENLAADSLPPSTDLRDNHVHGASKVAQVGPQSAGALLEAMLDGVDLSKMKGMLLLDLFPHTGDMLEAFALQQRLYSKKVTLGYMGFFDSQTHLTWAETFVKDSLVDKILEGSLNMPNGEKLEKEISPDLLDNLPPKPQLNVLVWTKDSTVSLPTAVVKKWQGHAVVGQQFAEFLEDFTNKGFTVADPCQESSEDKEEPSKRTAPGGDETGSTTRSPKRVKCMDLTTRLVQANAVSEALLFEASLAGKNPAVLQIRANHTVYLHNKTETEYSSPDKGFLTSFGKGQFKLVKAGDNQATGYTFNLTGSEDLVVSNGQVCTVGELVQTMREKKPDCQVCYHNLTTDPQNPKKFSLQQTHCVAFQPKALEEKDKLDQNNLGTKEPWTTWQGSDAMNLLWAVRWVTKGLTPVKPVVHLKERVVLKAGEVCRLSK